MTRYEENSAASRHAHGEFLSKKGHALRNLVLGGIGVSMTLSALFLPGGALNDTGSENPSPVASASYLPTPTPSETSPTIKEASRACKEGTPVEFIWPKMNIKADIIEVGLTKNGALDAPSHANRDKIGFYKDGSRPGSNSGKVILDGHRYENGTAVFEKNFAIKLAKEGLGSIISLKQDNGSICKYQVEKAYNVDKFKKGEGGFENLVEREKLYDQHGKEKLVGITCGGSWNYSKGTSQESTVFIGKPIN